MAARENKPVATEPQRIAGVVSKMVLKQQIRRRRKCHRSAGVAIANLLHRIHGEHARSGDGSIVKVCPIQRSHGGEPSGVNAHRLAA